MYNPVDIDEQLAEAERLATIGFHNRARNILESLPAYDERVSHLLEKLEKLEADFDANRNKRSVDVRAIVIATLLLIASGGALAGVQIGNDIIYWPGGSFILLISALWFIKQAVD